MNPAYYSVFTIVLVLLLVTMQERNGRRRRIIRNRKKRGQITMNEIIQNYLQQNCRVTVSGTGTITGTIASVSGNWINVETKKGTQAVNLDYVVMIQKQA